MNLFFVRGSHCGFISAPKPTKEPEEEGVAAKFVIPLRSETVPQDQSVTLTCKVKGTPFPEVAW